MRVRRWICVPMITLCLLTGCGKAEETADLRQAYREMEECAMEAVISCDQEGALWQATLQCDWTPEESVIEVLAPETIAGVRATLTGEHLQLEYEDLCLDAGELSTQCLSPADCLPRLMSALREGWLLEENDEVWQEIPCRRLTLDETGREDGKILSTIWLKQEDGTPLRGEIAVDGEIILTAEFTRFSFCDTMSSE